MLDKLVQLLGDSWNLSATHRKQLKQKIAAYATCAVMDSEVRKEAEAVATETLEEERIKQIAALCFQ